MHSSNCKKVSNVFQHIEIHQSHIKIAYIYVKSQNLNLEKFSSCSNKQNSKNSYDQNAWNYDILNFKNFKRFLSEKKTRFYVFSFHLPKDYLNNSNPSEDFL